MNNPFTLYPDGLPIGSLTIWPQRTEADILRDFYRDVCAEAERIMAETNKVEGAHWNAMRRVLNRKGIDTA